MFARKCCAEPAGSTKRAGACTHAYVCVYACACTHAHTHACVSSRTCMRSAGQKLYNQHPQWCTHAFLSCVRSVSAGQKLYNQHPQWSVLDVTGRSVEENSAIITELLGRPGKATPVEEALAKSRANFFLSVVKNAETGVTPAGLPPVMVSDSLVRPLSPSVCPSFPPSLFLSLSSSLSLRSTCVGARNVLRM